MADSPTDDMHPSGAEPGAPASLAVHQSPRAKLSATYLWERLKHHKVVQWTLAYLAVAYTLLHGAEMLAGTLNWSHGLLRLFTLVLVLGVPVVITLAWYHGARGQQRASGTEVMIIAILLALGGALLWRDSIDHKPPTESIAVATPEPAPNLPVVPATRPIQK